MFQIEEIPVKDITVKDRSRKKIDKPRIEKLKISIEKQGQLNPILITPEKRLIAGERRLIAMKELKFETIAVRIMPGLTLDEIFYIELIENDERDDFLWYEKITLKNKLHSRWKAQAENMNQSWGYRETAEKFDCAIGGLSTDLKLAEAIEKYPDLKLEEYENKSQAWQAYKKIIADLTAIHSMDNMEPEEKERLEKLRNGSFKKDQIDPSPAMHPDTPPEGTLVQDGSESEQTEEPDNQDNEPETRKPKAIFVVDKYENFIPKIPNDSVGFIELDPPYAIDFAKNYGNIGKRKPTENDWTVDQLKNFYHDYLPILYDKLLDNSWVFCWTGIEHWQMGNEYAKKAGFKVQTKPGFWVKPGGECNRPKMMFTNNYETFLLFRKGDATFNTASFKATIECPTTPGVNKVHQWEKSFAVYEKIFTAMARPGTIFLSPFAGSGNSMIIAEKHDMLAMGCDLRDKYFYNFYDRYNKFFIEI